MDWNNIFILKAIQEPCEGFPCEDSPVLHCISGDLVCDTIKHCVNGRDELKATAHCGDGTDKPLLPIELDNMDGHLLKFIVGN